jgi:CRP-like cAMP-binding protein
MDIEGECRVCGSERIGVLAMDALPMEQRQELDKKQRDLDQLAGELGMQPEAIRPLMQRVQFAQGEVIVRQGDIGDSAYFVLTGQAEVRVRRGSGELEVLGTLGPDEYFGEVGLLTTHPRTADVIAATPMTVLKLSQEAYLRYLSEHAELEQQVALPATKSVANRPRNSKWKDR